MKRIRISEHYKLLRTEIEQTVTAFRSTFKTAVKEWDDYTLLCNCHPLYRKDYAMRLHELGKLTDAQLKEFLTHKSYTND